MIQDIRYAVRLFGRKPLFAGTAILILAVGIAGATAGFSIVNAVLLRPLPFPGAEQLVRVWEVTPGGESFPFSEPNFLDFREQSRSFSDLAAYREVGGHGILDGPDPQRLSVVPVSTSLPAVLGITAQAGRLFDQGDDPPGAAEQPLVLSDGAWRARFGADPSAIGHRVRVNDAPFVIVGVLPADISFPPGADAWIPLVPSRSSERDNKDLAVVGRLLPRTTIRQAREELRQIADQIARAHPVANAGWSTQAVPFSEWIVAPRYRDAVWVLFGAVALLFVLACANVASLTLVQVAWRGGELRVRAALGAARGRIARQLLVESALLATLGTTVGILLAVWSVDAVRLLGADHVPRLESVRIDTVALGFASLTGVVSCILFGLVPALHATRIDLRRGLEEGHRYTSGGRPLRHAMVVVELALALPLLLGAGLMANSFVRLLNVDPGFDTAGSVAMPIELPPGHYRDERVAGFYQELLTAIRGIPGVSAAAATSTNPFREFGFSNSVTPEERAANAPRSGLLQAGWRSVTPDFFGTLRIPVLSGRIFNEFDNADSERVIVITDSLARRLWPGQSAVGKRIYWGGTTGRTRIVVGVVGDIRDVQLDLDTSIVFLPHAQLDLPTMTVVVRAAGGAESIAPLLRDALRRIDRTLPPPPVYSIETSRVETAAAPRFNLALLASFASIALLLAVTGVYGTLACNLAERRREIAVRLALGATGRRVVMHVLRNGLLLTLVGVTIGAALAVVTARALSTLLYDIHPGDPLTFAAAAAVLAASATAACLVSARQVLRIDPIRILRQ